MQHELFEVTGSWEPTKWTHCLAGAASDSWMCCKSKCAKHFSSVWNICSDYPRAKGDKKGSILAVDKHNLCVHVPQIRHELVRPLVNCVLFCNHAYESHKHCEGLKTSCPDTGECGLQQKATEELGERFSWLSALVAGDVELPRRDIKSPGGSAGVKLEPPDHHTEGGKSRVSGQSRRQHHGACHMPLNETQTHIFALRTLISAASRLVRLLLDKWY